MRSAARNHPHLTIYTLDAANRPAIAALARELDAEPVDILINNAGIYGGDRQSFGNIDEDTWLDTLRVNTLVPLAMIEAFRPHLKRAARPKVITISSQMGALSRNSGGSYIYRSSKAALNKVMQLAALDLKPDNIIVCPVHPGWVRTDMGGPQAEISVEESVLGLRALADRLTMADSGLFWQWNGQLHDW